MTDVLDRLKTALADRYSVEREIGSGGMATVYLAHDQKHDRNVAVKVLKPELAAALGPERFLREIEVTAKLRHPHILPLLDSGDAEGLLYYVMPFVEGESLRDRLTREQQLPVTDSVKIGLEVSDALGYAHSHDVVHRDIKPENILLEAGHAVVADFGIARAVTMAGSERLTDTGIVVGTLAYLSPEQAAGDQEIDGRSDVYAMGCVLYEMLTGEPPHTGPTVAAVLARKSTESPPSVEMLRTTVPPELGRAIDRALAVVPADRHPTATQLAEELEAVQHSGASAAERGRRKRPRALIGVVALIVAFGAVVVLWNALSTGGEAMDATAANRVIALPYDNETDDPSLDPIGRMLAEWITEGLAQSGEVQVVPNLMVMQTLAQLVEGEGRVPLQRMAHALESGIAVTGSYYRYGDSLEFHSTVVDVASGASLGIVEPTRGAAVDPMPAIDVVRGRVTAVLATRLNWLVDWELPPSVRPPSFEASQAYARGMSVFVQGQYAEGAEWFERAYALDTVYLRALVMAAGAHSFAGQPAMTDSLLRVIAPRRQELAPYDRLRADIMTVGLEGDLAAQWEISREAVRLVPIGTQRWAFIWGFIEHARPRGALTDLESDLESLRAVFGPWYRFWDLHTLLYHLIGEHERELEVAREGREQLPNSLPTMTYEGRALAALGQVDAVMQLAEGIVTLRTPSSTIPANALLSIALELRAHGYRDDALALVDSSLAWFDAQEPTWQSSGAGMLLHGRLLYARERWKDAEQVLAPLAGDSANVVSYLGYRGVIAARLGDWEAARSYAAQLENLDRPFPYQRGPITHWRADITALLGDNEETVRLLHQAMNEGIGWGMWLHTDMDLEPLHGFPPFEEMMRPEG